MASSSDWDDPLRQLAPITEHPRANFPIGDESSSALADPKAFSAALRRVNRLLTLYRPTSSNDDTTEILSIFLAKLPKEGQDVLLSDIIAIGPNDADLRTLRNHLVDAILKPMQVAGGQQPTTPMARFISTYGTEEVKKIELNCLRRDGFRCVACRAYDCNSIKDELVELPPGASMTTTQCAYIIPFALGNFYETKGPESKNKDLIWGALHRYFPALRGKIDATSIGQLGNLMTLDASAHAIFCGWDVALWPRDKKNTYDARSMDGLSVPFTLRDKQDHVEFISHVPGMPVPDKDFLLMHWRVGEMLEETGIAGKIILQQGASIYDAINMRPDGMTDVGAIMRRIMLMDV